MKAFAFLRCLGLPALQFRLPKLGGLCGVRSCLQRRFLEKVSPALMPVRGALFAFKVLEGRLRVLSSLNDFNNPSRLVGADVVTDDNIRSLEFVVCQMFSLCGPKPNLCSRVCAHAMISKLIRGYAPHIQCPNSMTTYKPPLSARRYCLSFKTKTNCWSSLLRRSAAAASILSSVLYWSNSCCAFAWSPVFL